jgi:hypothetical protein
LSFISVLKKSLFAIPSFNSFFISLVIALFAATLILFPSPWQPSFLSKPMAQQKSYPNSLRFNLGPTEIEALTEEIIQGMTSQLDAIAHFPQGSHF